MDLLRNFLWTLLLLPFSISTPSRLSEEDSVVEIHRSPELSKLSRAQLRFSQKLFKILKDLDSPNIVYSPLITHIVLSALKAAADGDTLSELNTASGLTKLNNSFIQSGYQDLIDMMKSDETSVVKLINRIFTSSLFKIDGAFARTLRERLNTHINPIDFTNTTAATERINSYISSYTNGTIRNFITDDILDTSNRVVILNSLYFKSEWEHEFSSLMTDRQPFNTDKGEEVEVEMMNRGGFYPYGEFVELNSTALSIPYKGGRFSLNFILPERGIPMSQLEKNLDIFPMQSVLSRMIPRYVQLSVPKFTLESDIDMAGPLQMLGVKALLSPHANLTKMSKKHGLFLGTMVQKATLAVNEGGTHASTSNFVEAVPVTPRFLVPFTVNRPFIVFLYDHMSDTILFVGKKLE